MATGERFRPLRRQASAAAVAMGPGMPLTMTMTLSVDAAIERDVWKVVVVVVLLELLKVEEVPIVVDGTKAVESAIRSDDTSTAK